MIAAHMQRAASLGAKMTALTSVAVAILVSLYSSNLAAGDAAESFGQRALIAVPFGLLVGALVGMIVFAVIGFFVGLLGIKRVGWTFTYTTFGAILAVILVQPFVDWFSSIANAAQIVDAGVIVITIAAALVGAVSGMLVAIGLKTTS